MCARADEAASAGGQPGLGYHRDDSELSFTILLSCPADFEGGGTAFELDQPAAASGEHGDDAARTSLVEPLRGEMVSHFGRLRHAGNPVDSGTRMVLAGFVRAQPLALAWRELQPEPREDADSP